MGRSYRVDGVTKPARAANHVHDGHNRPRTGPGMQASATMTADDRQAFGDLLQQHRGIVFKVANAYARSAEDRDDLAQEIAVQLWRAWPGYDPARRFSPWLYRIALNVAISFLRSAGHRSPLGRAPCRERGCKYV